MTAATIPLGFARPATFHHRLTLVLTFIGFSLSGIVFAEPAPVDLVLILLIWLVPAAGLMKMGRILTLYLMLWLLIVATGFVAGMQAFEVGVATKQVMVTLYLALSSVALAGLIQNDPRKHLTLIMNAYLVAAVLTTLLAVVGYFNVIPKLTDIFTLYERARGTFKDPNVYGAFVVPPMVYALHVAFNSRPRVAALALAATGFLVLGSLLSFSRGAWANIALSVFCLVYLSFLTSRSNRFRARILAMLAVAGIVGAIALGAALQSPKISGFFLERAQLEQSYDSEPNGRFAGHAKAKRLIASMPFGIGPLQFGGNYHFEDVHQVYLNMFLGHGWLGGGVYIVLVVLTLAMGLKGAFTSSPFQGLMIVTVSSYIGVVGEGFIVDTDHWRHFFLLVAAVWGLFLALPKTQSAELPSKATPRLARLKRA